MSLVPEGTPGARPIVVTALQMLQPAQLRPSRTPELPVVLVRSDPPDPELSRACYREVGAPWSWVDRHDWTLEQWREWVATDGHELWTCAVAGVRAGYFELSPEGEGVVQLAYFGLVPSHVGRGIGGWLLTEALRRAWALPGTTRVWLHTCTLDGPAALPNYLARGMVEFDSWVQHRLVTDPTS